MNWDPNTQSAINTGVANKRIIELVQNWCAHVTCETYGGTGLVEIQTGLPIGMRRLRCPHASAAGMAGMQLDVVALDFYDQNCSTCQKRQPVRLPNLSELVHERDRNQAQQAEANSRAVEQYTLALRERTARREALSKGCDPATAGLFDVIDQLDHQPNDQNARILIETAAATPIRFKSNVVEALVDLAGTEKKKIEPALTALAAVDTDRGRLCRVALQVLSRGIRSVIAAEIIAKNLDNAHRDLVPAALPSVIGLALPGHGFGPEDELHGSPEPIRSVHRLFPDLTLDVIKTLLRNSSKAIRITATNSVLTILEIDPTFGLAVIDGLIASFDLPDNIYGENGSARGWAAKTLARIMLDYPQDIDTQIQQAMGSSDKDKVEALFDVYEWVFRSTGRAGETADLTPAHELAYERMMEIVVRRVTDKRLDTATQFLRETAKRYPDLLERHADSLLGAAALIASELDAPSSPLLDLEVPPSALRELENQSKRLSLTYALNAAMEAVAAAAVRNPRVIAVSVVRTYEALDDRHERFKAALVHCLGSFAADPSGLKVALPPLYDAMTSQSVVVRGAAASAYGQVAQESPEDLPSLLHETFILLLADPYVLVHSRALNALRQISLPDAYVSRVRNVVLGLTSAHATNRKHEDVFAKCLAAALSLSQGAENSRISDRNMLVTLINQLSVASAKKLISDDSYLLRGATGLSTVLIRVLSDPDTDEYTAGICLSELRHVPTTEIAGQAEKLRQAAAAFASSDNDITDEVLDILTAASVWSVAAQVARDATQRLTDTRWDRPLKLRSRSRQLATEIEAAAASGEANVMDDLSREWLALDQEIRENDAES
jgi:hypothetical protein